MINARGESCTAAAAVRGYNAIIKEDEGNGGSGSFSNNFKAINYVYADHNNLYQL